jgi:hypothetical protein
VTLLPIVGAQRRAILEPSNSLMGEASLKPGFLETVLLRIAPLSKRRKIDSLRDEIMDFVAVLAQRFVDRFGQVQAYALNLHPRQSLFRSAALVTLPSEAL